LLRCFQLLLLALVLVLVLVLVLASLSLSPAELFARWLWPERATCVLFLQTSPGKVPRGFPLSIL